ncbi:hypothetical protein JOB18_007447 [Solea senegalensis]|nr:hypothetical protein JOB18_007447 [Solea senegalensis]
MNLPSREECEGWDQAQVASFLCQNKMPECATTIKKMRINGKKFLNMSDSDFSKFSLIHQPQLQKIVQDIKRKDGSLLNKLRRLKNKQIPKVPARDYGGDEDIDDQFSEPDYDNDMYEDPHADQDDSYEPPPSHRPFTTTSSFPTGEYLDSCRNQPKHLPRKPLRPDKSSRQMPPEPTHMGSEDEDYMNPDGNNDDNNYIEPAEDLPTNPLLLCRGRARKELPRLPATLPRPPSSPDFYEVPDKERSSLSSPSNRQCTISSTLLNLLPPKPCPRQNMRSAPTVHEPTQDDEYEVCYQDDDCSNKPAESRPPLVPKPLPRERSPKPPLRPRPDLMPKGFESQKLPVIQTEHTAPPKASTLDLSRPKIPLPQLTSITTDRRSVSTENGLIEEDENADVYKKPWYSSTCNRKTADDALLRSNKDGAFMVRKSSGHDTQQPYTLVVLYKGRVYNIPIRYIANTQQYALGSEKKGEEYFSSISHIIESHQKTPLVLIDSQSNNKDAIKLCYPITPKPGPPTAN